LILKYGINNWVCNAVNQPKILPPPSDIHKDYWGQRLKTPILLDHDKYEFIG
jgi:predicted oxidoreductase